MQQARKHLGLTQSQMARMLDMGTRAYQRYEANEREAPVRMTRLIDAYLDGHRPKDWPSSNKSKSDGQMVED